MRQFYEQLYVNRQDYLEKNEQISRNLQPAKIESRRNINRYLKRLITSSEIESVIY